MDIGRRNGEMYGFFTRKTDGYDDVHRKFMDSKRSLAENLTCCRKVLDLGAGMGLELIPLFERFPDAHVTAVDITESMLEELKKRDFSDRVTIICGDFFSVDFGGGFDAVISTSALHHFDEASKVKLYKKVCNSLIGGGRFINADKFADTEEQQEQAFCEYAENPVKYPHMDTPLTVANERRALLAAGFGSVTYSGLPDAGYRLVIAIK